MENQSCTDRTGQTTLFSWDLPMDIFLKTAAGILIMCLGIITFRQVFRGRKLYERTNAYCNFIGAPTTEREEQRTADGPLTAMLIRLGLAPIDDMWRVTLVFAPFVFAIGLNIAGWIVGIVLACGIVAASVMIARWRNHFRAQQFADRLPVFLDRVRRLVMIGNTLPHAFVQAVESADPVVKRHIYPVVRRLRYGASFQDSIELLSQQNNIAELHMLTAYVKTNAKFGGRVGQTLLNLINQLNNKRRLEREICAATSETRTSAAILFGLMALLIGSMSIMNPEYVEFYFGSDRGRLIFAFILVWPLIGILAMRQVLRLDF
jgi:tight adherence protein B